MPAGNPVVGDQNTRFIVTMKDNNNGTLAVLNLSVAAGLYDTFVIEFINQSLSVPVAKTATLYTDGTDGKIIFTNIDATFLNTGGTWKMRGKISKASTNTLFRGTWIEFEVTNP